MKIILVIPTLKHGGAERVMSELANEFVKLKHVVHLVLLTKHDEFYTLSPQTIVHRLDLINKNNFQKIFAQITALYQLRKILKTEKPDAILSFIEKANMVSILASRFLKTKTFISSRYNPYKKFSWSFELARRYIYRQATGIVAQTSESKEVIQKTIRHNNIRVIANPARSIQKYPKLAREKIIINVGRLVPEKGQQYLLEAFAGLKRKDWKLVILGDGPLRNNLLCQAEKLEIQNQLVLTGAVSNVDEWLAKSSIFVFSSISEGFPNALMEAMSAGLPCISFDCTTGPSDLIKDGVNGFLVEDRNVTELKLRMLELISNKQIADKMARNAMETTKEYEPSQIAQQYISFFTGN